MFTASVEANRNRPRSLGTTEADLDENDPGTDFFIDFLRLLGEYGGAMNTTIINTLSQVTVLCVYNSIGCSLLVILSLSKSSLLSLYDSSTRLNGSYQYDLYVLFLQFDNLGVYLPQCVQHIHIATSTLRAENGILGNGGVEFNESLIQFE